MSNPMVYDRVRTEIKNGDIAVSRGYGLLSKIISLFSHSQYTHATILGWAKPNTLMLGETRQWSDGRLIDARSEIQNWGGYYDVYRPIGRYHGAKAWSFICHSAGAFYGWRHLFRAFIRRVFGKFIPPLQNSDEYNAPRSCSALVHAALRAGQGPQVEEFDCDVAPGDLTDPKKFTYLFTLCFTQEQVDKIKSKENKNV